jgi:methylmalonyl-CoA/ethylmalonyl-CoA epimerase
MSDSGQQFGLGPIDQISFAVRSIDDALPRYTAMFGPFVVVDVPGLDVRCRGRASTTTLKLAFGRSRDVEIELVEVVTGDWPTIQWLASNGEGLHHIRYPVDEVASSCKEMVAAGFEVTLEGSAGGVSFVYLESPFLNGMTVELTNRT